MTLLDEAYEELFTDINGKFGRIRDRLNIPDIEKDQNKANDPNVKDTNSNYNDGKVPLDSKFIERLSNYIDSIFPSTGDFSSRIKVELRKVVKNKNDKELEKTNKKVKDILYKEYHKFLDNIEKRMAKILLEPK
jgi:hypothetical protein